MDNKIFNIIEDLFKQNIIDDKTYKDLSDTFNEFAKRNYIYIPEGLEDAISKVMELYNKN